MENAATGRRGVLRREILHFGKSKGDISYLEAREQFDRGVLLREDYLNGIINLKVHSKHLKGVSL